MDMERYEMNHEDFRRLDEVIEGFTNEDFEFEKAVPRETKVETVWNNLKCMKQEGLKKLLRKSFLLMYNYHVEDDENGDTWVRFYLENAGDLLNLCFVTLSEGRFFSQDYAVKNVKEVFFLTKDDERYSGEESPRKMIEGALA